MEKQRKKLPIFYSYEMVEIYKIIVDDNIIDKEQEIKKIGDYKKLDISIKKGYYSNIEDKLDVIKNWFNKININGRVLNKNSLKENEYSEIQLTKKLNDLLYLNKLYENEMLNENTYYPVFEKIQDSKILKAPSFKQISNSEVISKIENEEVKRAINNIAEIEKKISLFHSGIAFKNLFYRKKVEEELKKNNYLENYSYAEYLLKTYIKCKEIYRTNEFLSYMNIDKQHFEECINLISFLNPTLYNEYLQKRESDHKKNIVACKYEFEKVANEIKNYEDNGQEMPKEEFFSKAPFLSFNEIQRDYTIDYMHKVKNFIDDSRVLSIITEYLYQNGMQLVTFANCKHYLQSIISIKEHILTNEDRNNIYLILKYLNLPSVGCVLNNVTLRHLNGKYNVAELEEKYNSKFIKCLESNPYQYIKSNKKQ